MSWKNLSSVFGGGFSRFFRKKPVDETTEKQKEDLLKEAPSIYELAVNGKDCDSLINNAKGIGHIIENPIPVNGVLGEMKYINRLRCSCGSMLLFHRIGPQKNSGVDGCIDVYETVCLEGRHWDILYLHLYHPRRSKWCPEGYSFSEFHTIFSKYPIGYGTNQYDENFPFGLGKFIAQQIGGDLGRKMSHRLQEKLKEKTKFIRPKKQKEKILSFIPNDARIIGNR